MTKTVTLSHQPSRWRESTWIALLHTLKARVLPNREWQRKNILALLLCLMIPYTELLWEKSRNVWIRDGDGDKNQKLNDWLQHQPLSIVVPASLTIPLRGHGRWGTSDSEKRWSGLASFFSPLCTNSAKLDNRTSSILTVYGQAELAVQDQTDQSQKALFFLLSTAWERFIAMLK